MLALDFVIVGRRPHEPSPRESALWVSLYVALAVAFGGWVWSRWGGVYAGEFFAGWLTEYSLSVDNLFVFVIIMRRFSVPREYQQKVLTIGIFLALMLRGGFSAAGAVLAHQFVWIFYLFGGLLLYTAWKLVRHGEDDEGDFHENGLIRWSRRVLPLSEGYDQARLTTTRLTSGADRRHRVFIPLLVLIIAIGTTDLIFALDSIPATSG